MAVTEARWITSRKQQLAGGETIMWSGRENGCHRGRTDSQQGKEQQYTRWKPVNYRILYVQFDSKFAKLSMIVACAPTEEGEE